jgi:hypothetical protein
MTIAYPDFAELPVELREARRALSAAGPGHADRLRTRPDAARACACDGIRGALRHQHDLPDVLPCGQDPVRLSRFGERHRGVDHGLDHALRDRL